MLNYSLLISDEIELEPEIGDYKSYYFTWYNSSYGDVGPYEQRLSSSQERPYYDYNSSIQEETDEGMQWSYGGGGNTVGCYFGGYSGDDDVYSDKGYDTYGISLDTEDHHYQGVENLSSYQVSNDDMQLSNGDDQ